MRLATGAFLLLLAASSAAQTLPRDTVAIPDTAWLEIHIVDVGQGDAIWIRTCDDGVPGNGRFDGRNITIDGGPNGSDGSNSFLPYIRERARPDTRFDAVIISHPDDDHYLGARGVLRHYEVCNYLRWRYAQRLAIQPVPWHRAFRAATASRFGSTAGARLSDSRIGEASCAPNCSGARRLSRLGWAVGVR